MDGGKKIGVFWKERLILNGKFSLQRKIKNERKEDILTGAKRFDFFDKQKREFTLDLEDTFTRFTSDVIATTAFGINCDSMRDPQNGFYMMGKKMTTFRGFKNNLRFMFVFIFPRLAKILGLRLFDQQSQNFFVDIVKENLKSRETTGIVRQDMIHLLMEARKGRLEQETEVDGNKPVKEPLTDMDIIAQALIFFFAGFASVATAMCFTAFELAINVDVQERLQKEIDDTIAECDGNLTYDALSKMKYMNMVISGAVFVGKKMTTFRGFKNNLRFMFVFIFPRLAKILGLRLFDQQSQNFFVDIVKENLKSRETTGIVRQDMIHLLMEARKGRLEQETEVDGNKPVKEPLTDMDIIAQALIFFFAGFASVATAMCFTAFELAINVDVQERLQKEIDDTIAECDGNLTYDALSKMKYMNMVISESLRKWPPAVISDRICVKPYVIEPVEDGEVPLHVRKGEIIAIPTLAMQRDPKYFPDPERFDPERFSDENKNSINQYMYIPFGVGPRSCIGNRALPDYVKMVYNDFGGERALPDYVNMIYHDFGGEKYFGVYQFSQPTLVIRDFDLIKQLTVKDFDYFMDHFQVVPENNEPMWEKNLFSLQERFPITLKWFTTTSAVKDTLACTSSLNQTLVIKDFDLIKQLTVKDFDYFMDHFT
ncbi:hypothetical protein FQR65_LT18995 [Abscondita terminalis]|nr:hypothetical protein FQR65_LT18995 [Abscondita terminalis]